MWCTSLVKGAQWPKQPKILCRSLSCWSKLRSSPTLQSKTTEEEKKINNLVSTTSQCRRHLDKLSFLFDLDLFTNLRGFIKNRRSENSLSTMHNSPGKFQWSMAIFYSDESDMDTLCYCKKKLFPEMQNFNT